MIGSYNHIYADSNSFMCIQSFSPLLIPVHQYGNIIYAHTPATRLLLLAECVTHADEDAACQRGTLACSSYLLQLLYTGTFDYFLTVENILSTKMIGTARLLQNYLLATAKQ